MSDVNPCGGKRIRKSPAAEGQGCGARQVKPVCEPEPRPARQETEADRLLRRIFFRRGPLPMAPDQGQGK